MNNQVNKISETFLSDIGILDNYFQEIRNSIKELNTTAEDLKKYIEKGGSVEVKPRIKVFEERDISITAGLEDNSFSRDALIFSLNNRIKHLKKYIEISLIMSFTYLITIFEAKYIDLMRTYINHISKNLNSEEKAQEKLTDFSKKSFSNQVASLKINFNIDLERILGNDVINSLIEIRETRNIYMHNSGIVDEKYLKYVKNTSFKKGEYRTLDAIYVKRAKLYIKNFIGELKQQIMSKNLDE